MQITLLQLRMIRAQRRAKLDTQAQTRLKSPKKEMHLSLAEIFERPAAFLELTGWA